MLTLKTVFSFLMKTQLVFRCKLLCYTLRQKSLPSQIFTDFLRNKKVLVDSKSTLYN